MKYENITMMDADERENIKFMAKGGGSLSEDSTLPELLTYVISQAMMGFNTDQKYLSNIYNDSFKVTDAVDKLEEIAFGVFEEYI